MGCNECRVEDIVQDMYIKVHKQIEDGREIIYGNGAVNTFYIYLTLRSVYTDQYREAKRECIIMTDVKTEELHDTILANAPSVEEVVDERERELRLCKIYENIVNEMNSWDDNVGYPYNKQIFLAYTGTNVSFRQLAKDTGIPFNSIVNTVTKGRNKLKEKFGEEIGEYLKEFHSL
jgi:RNA polymerase sigma factor (sigma-70 family)